MTPVVIWFRTRPGPLDSVQKKRVVERELRSRCGSVMFVARVPVMNGLTKAGPWIDSDVWAKGARASDYWDKKP